MRRASLLLLTLSLGCSSGKIEIPDEFYEGLTDEGEGENESEGWEGEDGEGWDPDEDRDGDGRPDGDGDRPDRDDDNRPDDEDDWPDDDDWDDDWGGDWAEFYGEVQMYLVNGRGDYVDFCAGENFWYVDDGWAGGEGSCEIYRGNRAGDYMYLSYEGEEYGDTIYGSVWVYRSWSDNWDELEWQAYAYNEGGEGYIESYASGWMETYDGGRQLDAYGWGYRY